MHKCLLRPCYFDNHQMIDQKALSSIIIIHQGLCLSLFFLWAPTKATCLQNLLLPQFIFALICIFLWGFSLPWLMTPISLALPMLSPSYLIIFVFQLVFVGLSVQPCKCSAWVSSGLPLGFKTKGFKNGENQVQTTT